MPIDSRTTSAPAPAYAKRPLCRTCLDWSEHRPRLAGRIGAALMDRSLALGWIARVLDSRAIRITTAGQKGFVKTFGAQLVGRISEA